MSKTITLFTWLWLGLAGFAVGSLAVAAEITIPGITLQNRQTMHYRCEDGAQFKVTYINTTDQQGFAVVPVDGKNRLFVTLMSGSGARYGSGPYIWWSKGEEAVLSNEQNAEQPLHGTCLLNK